MKDKDKNKNNHQLSDTERHLWDSVTKGITPIDPKTRQKRQPLPPKKEPPSKKQTTTAAKRHTIRENPVQPAGTGIDRRTAQKLERGQFEIEARLDLHGMTKDRAHKTLGEFIRLCWNSGKRTVLVITGKGSRSAEKTGVLRQALPEWLGTTPLNAYVLKITPARSKDGGDGAFYVRLRRKR